MSVILLRVNMHFRCRVRQAQILDVIRCHLFDLMIYLELEHPCYVYNYKITRHEHTNLLKLLKSTVLLLSLTSYNLKLLYVLSAATAILNLSEEDNTFNARTMCLLCNCLVLW